MFDISLVGLDRRVSRILLLQLTQINVKACEKTRLFFQELKSIGHPVPVLLINGKLLSIENFNLVKEAFPDSKVISYGATPVIDNGVLIINEVLEEAVLAIKNALKSITDFDFSSDAYLPVPLNYFLDIRCNDYGCDIFIKIKKETHIQLVKLLSAEHVFSINDLERYFKSGLEKIFISKEQFPFFLNLFTEQVTLREQEALLEQTSEDSLISDAYKITRDQLELLNVDEMTIEIVEENIRKMMKSVGAKNALSKFLKALKEEKYSYLNARVYLTTLLMFKVLDSFEWNSTSIRKSVTYLCFFHDIGLSNDEHLKIRKEEDLLSLSKNEVELVMSHAARAAEILEKFPKIPLGTSSLIREHHGNKSGKGFAKQFSATLSPISVMFIVVEDFVTEFLEIARDLSKKKIEDIFTELEARHSKGTFAQTLAVLKKVICPKP